MTSWIASARSRPAISPASQSARTMPADTPAAVTTLPECTMRSSGCDLAPIILSTPILYQCVVAGKPFKIPAEPNINEPVQTEAVQVVVLCTSRNQSSTSSSTIWLGVVIPPGTTATSGEGVSVIVCVAPSRSAPPSVITGPTSLPTNRTSVSGIRDKTSYGPTASSAVTPG